VALSELDRKLINHCLARRPRAWEDFVDRFMGLIVHVVNHTAGCRSIRLSDDDRDDLTADVFLEIVKDDFGVLRRFRGQSSLATYLAVVARRVVVHELVSRRQNPTLGAVAEESPDHNGHAEQRVSDRDEVERLLGHLDGNDAAVVRMYHLEGKSYREISQTVGMPENTIGPTLSRARAKLRHATDQPAT
jgi:RNA polymerase sigma-70 factor, ECF subfamily